MPNGQISRKQLLSQQDILNIQHQLNVESIQKHTNDLLSTCAWVNEMQYNPVLLFKREPSGRDPRLRGKVIQTIILKYNMPKDYNYHCSFVWSYNNENVYFRLFSLCIKH